MIYQHPLAYLLGLEGLALLRAWGGDEDFDEQFVRERFAAVRALLADAELTSHPGVLVERDATASAYAQWAGSYDQEDNGLLELDLPLIDAIVADLPRGRAIDAGCGTGRLAFWLAARGFRVTGIDGSDGHAGASPSPRQPPARTAPRPDRADDLEFEVGDLTDLPSPRTPRPTSWSPVWP